MQKINVVVILISNYVGGGGAVEQQVTGIDGKAGSLSMPAVNIFAAEACDI